MFKNLFKKNNSFPPKEENVNVKEQESFAGKIETIHDKKKVYEMEELLPNSKFLTDEEEREIAIEEEKEHVRKMTNAILERQAAIASSYAGDSEEERLKNPIPDPVLAAKYGDAYHFKYDD